MSFSEWNEFKLSDICAYKTGKLNSNAAVLNGKYPFFTCSPETLRINKYSFDQDAVILAGNNANGVFSIKHYEGKFDAYQRTYIINTLDENIINNKYLYYFLGLQLNQLKQLSVGSATKFLTKTILDNIIVQVPNNQVEINSIVNILSTLDKKIEVNNQINKTLEEMAQAIFKQWFVDFDFPNEDGEPYKSSGGEMVESELGMIPKGWEVGVFRDYVETILGGDWGKEFSQGNYIKEVNCLRGADIPEVRVGKKGALPKRYILEKNYNNKKLKHGDLVVEISGGSPTQSTGRITYITEDLLSKYDSDFVCTNFCRAITLENKQAMEYLFFYWQQLYDQNVFFQYENGTTGIKNLDINTFLDTFQIIKPSKLILEKYHEMIGALLKKIQINGDENIKLADIRDTLLPKLMSGEIRVPLNE